MTSINHHNNLCLVTLHFPSSTSCHCPGHVPFREVGKKFDEILNLKNTSNNNPTNILNNLCSGLETFLGFDSESKGYDGSGIVYSDLDRLCDGVMGFLSGVLSNIKDHLGQHKNEITQAISILNTHKHLGKKGFNEAIGSVVAGVGGYNKAVEQSNEKIKKPINDLLSKLGTTLTDKLNAITPHDVSGQNTFSQQDIDKAKRAEVETYKLLREYKEYATTFNRNLDIKKLDVKNAVNDLNSNLSRNVICAIGSVKHETERLEQLAETKKEDKEVMVKLIDTKLQAVKGSVNVKIECDLNSLIDALKPMVKKILEGMQKINKKLRQCVVALGKWIDDASEVIKTAETQVNKIMECIDEGSLYKYPNQITQAVQQIEASTNILHGKFEELRDKYNEVYNIIHGDGEGSADTGGVIGKFAAITDKVPVPQDADAFGKGSGWNLSRSIELFVERIKDNVEEYLDAFANSVVDGIQVAEERYSSGIITPGQTPAFDAMINKVGRSELKNRLGDFGLLLESAKLAEGSIGGLGDHIEKVLKHLYDAKKSWNVRPTLTDIYGRLKSSVQHKAAKVQFGLGVLLKETASTAIGKLRGVVSDIVSEHLETIAKLNGDIEGIAEVEKVALQTHAQDVMNKIKSLCTDIRNVASEEPNSAKAKLLELKNTYFAKSETVTKSINKIHSDLSKLQQELESGPIKDAEDFVKPAGTASKEKEKIAKQLQKHVEEQIKTAQTALTIKAQTQYAASLKALLKAFNDKVHEDMNKLPKEITDDLDIGYKGFMNKFEKSFITGDKSIVVINDIVNKSPQNEYPLRQAAGKFNLAVREFIRELEAQPDFKLDSAKSKPSYSALTKLLSGLLKSLHFDHTFSTNLDALNNAVTAFIPATYGEAKCPSLLNALKAGFTPLVEEMYKAYINKYEGGAQINWDDKTEQQYGAKVFCTISSILLDDLSRLRKRCRPEGQWRGKQICLVEHNAKDNQLGLFLEKCGYSIAREKQEGELRNAQKCKGEQIYGYLTADIASSQRLVREHDEKDDEVSRRMHGILRNIVTHVHVYFSVCHLPTVSTPKFPSSIYQMLMWVTGLPHNPVYDGLSFDGFGGLFEKSDKASGSEGDEFSLIYDDDESLPAYPENISASKLRGTLAEVCHYAYETLTAIVGYGYSDGIYACDFNTNPHKLTFPSNPGQCLDLLVEILNRVYHQLCFLYNQCSYESDLSGWADCWYGQQIGGSSWQCNDKLCADQKCDQNHNQHPTCGVKSPLQSFLEDGLPGFLPHPYSKPDCKMGCSLTNHRGLPCKTPMGLADISHLSSHTQKGARIYGVLADFCGNEDSPLSKMCSYLTCLFTTPPKTLGDMFAFYYGLVNGWNDAKRGDRMLHRENAIDGAVKGANFGNSSAGLDISPLFESATHKGTSTTHVKGDLFMLVKCNGETAALDPVGTCGTYLKSLCGDVRNIYSKEHADKYLSWIVYLTETFYDLLSKLLEDCKSKCGSPKSRCQQQTCVKNCRSVVSSTKSTSLHHEAACKSIVQCKASLPNLYKYGFYYGNTTDLSGTYGETTKRTCSDFCKALERVLNKEKHSAHVLAKLVFKTIPEFLFTIRAPFIWLNVALWLLSLLYLLHIMVIRLDLLHIKSHLHSPSSHRIAAQSLLAAGRVNKLGRVFYLQP